MILKLYLFYYIICAVKTQTTVVVTPALNGTKTSTRTVFYACPTSDVTCKNGGICLIYNGSYKICRCPPGFLGVQCEVATLSSILPEARQNGLSQLNLYRSRHNTSDLQLDEELNQIAQSLADSLMKSELLLNNQTSGFGKSFYKIWDSKQIDYANVIKVATNYWYAENQYYDYLKPGYSPVTTDFVNIVWESTRKVGFGLSAGECKLAEFIYKCAVVVANFVEPGGQIGLFEKNVLKPI